MTDSSLQADEFAPFYQNYVSLAGTAPIIQTLESLKHSTYLFLVSLHEDFAGHAYAPGKWTVKQLVSHMIDAERIFAYRVLCISPHETQPLPGFDENEYVANAHANLRTLHSLAEEFKQVRESNLFIFKSLTAEQWRLKGTASNSTVSVRALACIMAGHELHHLNVLKQRYLNDHTR